MADYKDQGRMGLADAIEEAIERGGMTLEEVRAEVEYILECRAEAVDGSERVS